MTVASDITVFYAVTPDLPYPRYAAQSIYSALRATPGIHVRLTEIERAGHPESVRIRGLPGPEEAERPGWCLILDADTWINRPLTELLDRPRHSLNLRVANAWETGQINHARWRRICRALGVPDIYPVYCTNCILCTWDRAAWLGSTWQNWQDRVVGCGKPDPLQIDKRPEWWMRDQYALSAMIAVPRWDVGRLTARDISWQYCGESGGIVHHEGKKFTPFTEKRWANYHTSTA